MKTSIPEINTTSKFLKQLDLFILENQTGIRLQKNGKFLQKTSVSNYENIKNLLEDFSKKKICTKNSFG